MTQAIVANLSNEQREILAAYADGVNAYIRQMDTAPFEFLLLGYQPEPWMAEEQHPCRHEYFSGAISQGK